MHRADGGGTLGGPAWRELGSAEFDEVWSQVSILPPEDIPARRHRIPEDFNLYDPARKAPLAEFHRLLLLAFRTCLPPGGRMYALDYQHASYEFRPHAPFDAGADEEAVCGFSQKVPGIWKVALLPDGDDTIYVDEALSFGSVAAWSPQTITFFGAPLLACLDRAAPAILSRWPREA